MEIDSFCCALPDDFRDGQLKKFSILSRQLFLKHANDDTFLNIACLVDSH